MGFTPLPSDPLQRFARLIDDMPGGSYIKDAWLDEPRLVIFVKADDDSAEEHRIFTEITGAFPPACSQVSWSVGHWLCLPQLAAHMLTWYADDGTWHTEEYDFPELPWSGADLAVRLDKVTDRRGWSDGYNAIGVLAQLVASAQLHGIDDLDELIDTVSGLIEEESVDNAVELACALVRERT